VLQSLPAEVQKHIEDTRAECRAYWNSHGIADPSDLWPLLVSSGDEGLISFTLSGARAVIVSDLHLCGDQCIKSVTCSTAGGSSFDIYVRTGQRLEECPLDHGLWSGILEPRLTRLNRNPPAFRAMVLGIPGDSKDCPKRRMFIRTYGSTAWKLQCDVIVK
jgi:hypothetical protein